MDEQSKPRRSRRRNNPCQIPSLWKCKSKQPWSDMLKQARKRAKDRGMDFDLSHEWAAARWTGACEMTGVPFKLGSNRATMFSPSLDRIDCKRGYTANNTRFVLNAVNMMKSTGTDADVLAVAKALVEYAAPNPIQ